MSISTFDLFKIGIGPSSSHTVGPMVAAKKFIDGCNDDEILDLITKVSVELFGSLGSTGKGHGTFKAIILGLEGETPVDVDISQVESRINNTIKTESLTLLSSHTIHFNKEKDITFHRKKTLPYHSNGLRFQCFDQHGNCLLEKYYYSVGGGFVIDENQAASGDPIIKDSHTLPYPFTTGKKLLELCHNSKLTIAEIMIENEKVWRDENTTATQLTELWEVMQTCVKRGCQSEGILPGGLKVERRAKKLFEKLSSSNASANAPQHAQDPL